MELFYRKKGEGEPLILLHGLFGSADNLGGIARILETDYQVISVDMRNHGRSPHDPVMSYEAMADDIVELMDKEGIASAYVFGHSMGGKAAMELALRHGNRVKKLIVGDIAPVQYERHHDDILRGLQAVVEAAPQSRKEAENVLASFVSEPDILSFLLANWRRQEDGSQGWRLNLDALVADYDHIIAGNGAGLYEGPVLFLRGGKSGYIKSEHRDYILRLFPNASVRTVEGTGHWLHAEKPDTIARLVGRFLSE